MSHPKHDTSSTPQVASEPIAIVGWACRFPGSSSSPAKLWKLLREPRDVLSDLSRDDRFNQEAFYHPNGLHHGTSHVKQSYILDEDPRMFDASFFGIKPVEAHVMDPQQRILLETVYESMESGGLSVQGMAGSQTAVYVGQMWADYDVHVSRDVDAMPTYTGTGTARSMLSNRVSHFFDWHGPSVTLDTACSSSLVAVYNAVLTLRNGDASAAVAAGANLILTPEPYVGMSNLTMISPDSRSRMWDANVKGYARGEGVAAVVLKRLSDAVRDGDRIEGVIREIGVNQDGRTREGITMPSQHAQRALIQHTYAKAGLDISKKDDRCQYFEAHGTGTAAGDPREAEAIASAFFGPSLQSSDGDDILYVGSIKTVIGHTEGTAGIAGIMKACLALQQGEIPPNLLFETLNPKVAPFYTNLEIPTQVKKWPELPPGTPRRASVNSFGFGGTNAHAILESYVPVHEQPIRTNNARPGSDVQATLIPIVLSASSASSLKATVKKYVAYLEASPSTSIHDLAYTLSSRRSVLPVRATFAASSADDLTTKLNMWIQETNENGDSIIPAPRTSTTGAGKRIIGVFTGQGAQWATMGRELLSAFPVVQVIVDRLEESLQSLPLIDRPDWSISDELAKDASQSRLGQAAISQPLCTAIQIVLVDLLHAAGIRFQAVVGHSSGEIGAAYAAGLLNSRDAIRIAYYRGVVAGLAGSGANSTPGAMMAVATSYEDAEDLCGLEILQGRVRIAAVNSATSLTLSGDAEAVEEARLILQDEGKFSRLLRVDKAYHSHYMLPCSEPYIKSMRDCRVAVGSGDLGTTWFSSVYSGTKMTALSVLGDQYWVDNMVRPVLFSQAVRCAVEYVGPFDAVIEVGPHPALKGPTMETLTEGSGSGKPAPRPEYVGLLSRNQNGVESFAAGLGALWAALGSDVVNFKALDQFVTESAPRTMLGKDLPTYSWDHNQVYWHESRQTRALRMRQDSPHDLLGSRTIDGVRAEMRWRNLLRLSEIPWVRGHTLQGQVVFPGTAYVVTALEAARMLAGSRKIKTLEVRDFTIHRAIALDESQDTETLVTLSTQHEDPESIVATFQYHACIQKGASDMALVASSSIHVLFDTETNEHLTHALAERDPPPPNLIDVDEEEFYEFLNDVGYNYAGSFRGLRSIKRKLDYGMGSLTVMDEDWGGPRPIIAPSVLDLALQSIFIAFGWPRDGSLLDVHVPVSIESVKLDVPSWTAVSALQPHVDFVSSLRGTRGESAIAGDVGVFCPTTNVPLVQFENIVVVPLSPEADSLSREIYTKTTYWPLYVGPQGFIAQQIPNAEKQYGWDLERVSLFYMRELESEFPPEKRDQLAQPHHKFFFEFTAHAFLRVSQGTLPFVKKEWLNDTKDDINAIVYKYSDKVDIQLLRIIGENMAAAMRGETDILQHMFRGDTMERWYAESLGFDRLMKWLGEMSQHIARIHPRMNILELGAGTGAATKSIINHIRGQFASYTYTDISASFFEKAAVVFPSPRMIFKTLDLEKDVESQGFRTGSYDMVIASNVLHATRELDKSLQVARSLLKPGGYLLVCEITTQDVLHVQLPFSCLPGWWLGRGDGRLLGATIDTLEWNERLLRTGFSGIDAISDEANTLVLASNIMVSQAMDNHVQLLREPLASASLLGLGDGKQQQQLVIVGGMSVSTAALVGQVSRLLSSPSSRPARVRCLEDLARMNLQRNCAVIHLGDLDEPALYGITDQKLLVLKALFQHPRTILWVTRGCRADNPLQNMSIGLGRVLMVEMPTTRLQFLDIANGLNPDSGRLISETYLRWRLLAEYEADLEAGTLLWTDERELVCEDGNVMTVPRISFDRDMNQRYMASRQMVTQQLSPAEVPVVLERLENGSWSFAQSITTPLTVKKTLSHKDNIKVILSSATPCYGGWYATLGTDSETRDPVVALSSANESFISSPVASLPIDTEVLRHGWALVASTLAMELQVCSILDHVPFGSVIVLNEPSIPLAVAMSRRLTDKLDRAIYVTKNGRPITHPTFPWTVVPHQSSARGLATLAKQFSSAAVVIDCDESSSSSPFNKKSVLDRVVPRSCWRVALRDLVTHKASVNSSEIVKTLSMALANVSQGINDWPATADGDEAVVYIKRVEQLDLSHDLDNATSLVIDWATSLPVPVLIRPIDDYVHFSPNKTYMLFGLTSDLGQSIAEWIIAHGARHIVLTSRSPQIGDAWFQSVREIGATVKVFSNDITSEESVRDLVDEVRNTMPPIGGVANGAMVLRDSAFLDTSVDQASRILAPKVAGTQYLDSIFDSRDRLDFFILFSSVACLSGNRSQSIYSAANMFMTALVANRRKRGLVGSVMHIGAIFGVGYMSRTSGRSRNLLEALWASGADWLSERDLQNAFGEAVLAGRPELNSSSEFSFGFRSLKLGLDTAVVMSNPRFSHLLVDDVATAGSGDTGNNRTMAVKTRLQEAKTLFEVEQIIRENVVAKLIAILQLDTGKPEAEILASAPEDLGADSLGTVDLRNWFATELRVDVPVLKLLGGNTVAQLVEYAMENLPAEITPNIDVSGNINHDTASKVAPGAAPPTSAEYVPIRAEETPPPRAGSSDWSSNYENEIGRSLLLSTDTPSDTDIASVVTGASDVIASAILPRGDSRSLPLAKWKHDTSEKDFEKSEVVKSVAISLGQSRFWFLQHYLKDKTALNVSFMAKLVGSMSPSALANALEKVASVHEALRTAFVTEAGVAKQSVLAKSPLVLELRTISSESEAHEALTSVKRYDYDLERGETMKMMLLILANSTSSQYLVIGYHHINMDGISLEVLLSDLQKAYYGERLEAPVQYTEFSVRQHDEVRQGRMAEEAKYWRQELADSPPPLPLLPFASTASRTTLESYAFKSASTSVSSSIVKAIQAISKSTKTSLFHFFLATYSVLLHRYTSAEEVCIGMTDAGRDFGRYAQSIGFYLNLLPLRLSVSAGDTIDTVLTRVRTKMQKAMAHSRLPFNQILQAAKAELSDTHNPLFQAAINYRPGINIRRTFCGCEGKGEDINAGATAHDMMLDIVENPGGEVSLTFHVQSALYSHKNAQTLLDGYLTLLTAFSSSSHTAVDSPPLYGMSEQERQRTIQLGQGPERSTSWSDTVVHRIEMIASQQPNSIAITSGLGPSMTYRGIAQRIRTITAAIGAKIGHRTTPTIAVYAEPSSETVCAMLAVMRTGAAYLPLDPRVPIQRLAIMANIAGVGLVLTDDRTDMEAQELQGLIHGSMTLKLSTVKNTLLPTVPNLARPGDNVAVLFTSGTTGTPKGIELTHSALLGNIETSASLYGIASTSVLQQTSASFDAYLFQTFFALCCGGKLVIVPQEGRLDPAVVAATIRDEGVTFTLATPSEYAAWLQHGRDSLQQSNSWQMAAQGGEMYSPQVAKGLRDLELPDLQLLNLYGPSEVSIYCSQGIIDVESESRCFQTGQPTPAGHALPNVSVYILDHERRLVPAGMVGQIFVGGSGVARGYIHNPDLTNSNFIEDPFASPFAVSQGWTRMYATGDRGWLDSDGVLTVLGRIEGDTQIKIRGMRTELNEIEKAILSGAGGMLEQVVVTSRGQSASLFLVAHVTLSPSTRTTGGVTKSITKNLQKVLDTLKLPLWMRPAIIIPLARLPLSLHGKIDRRAVAALPVSHELAVAAAVTRDEDFITETGNKLTESQQQMLQVWEYVLGGASQISSAALAPTTDFFRIGGTSLQLIQIQSEVLRRFDFRVPVIDLFKNNTLDSMSAVVFPNGGTDEGRREPKADVIDWDEETSPPHKALSIDPVRTIMPPGNMPRRILLTGATGFVGQALLRALIAHKSVDHIHCVAVRDPAKLGTLQHHPKLVVHLGDLADASLSLSVKDQTSLAQTVDVIIHNGADVSFLKPYANLRKPNVSSTRFLIALAAPRAIPLHYISSASVGRLLRAEPASQAETGCTTVFPAISLADSPPPLDWADGYTASKWASEVLLERAAAEPHLAVPATIHRLSSVTPNQDSSDDSDQTTDVVGSVVQYSMRLCAVPDPKVSGWRGSLDFVSVGRVANGVVAALFPPRWSSKRSKGSPITKFLFQSSEQVVPVESIAEYIADRLGIMETHVQIWPMDKWLARARQAGIEELIAVFLEESQKRSDSSPVIFQKLVSS